MVIWNSFNDGEEAIYESSLLGVKNKEVRENANLGKLPEVDLDAALGRNSLLLAKLVEGRAYAGVRIVKGQHFNLSPGITTPPAQHLEHGSIDAGLFEQLQEIVSSDRQDTRGDHELSRLPAKYPRRSGTSLRNTLWFR